VRQLHPTDFLYKTEEQRQRDQAEWEREEKRAELQEEANRTTIERNRAAIRAANVATPAGENNQTQPLTKFTARPAEERKRAVPSPIGTKMLDDFIREKNIATKDWLTFGCSIPTIRETRKGGSLTPAKWAMIAKRMGVPVKTLFPEE